MSERKEEIIEERIYNVPLSRAWIAPIKKRTPRAVRVLKAFIGKHMKPENLIISDEVNKLLWSQGIEGAPRHIRVRAVKGRDNTVTVYLAREE